MTSVFLKSGPETFALKTFLKTIIYIYKCYNMNLVLICPKLYKITILIDLTYWVSIWNVWTYLFH